MRRSGRRILLDKINATLIPKPITTPTSKSVNTMDTTVMAKGAN